MPSLLAHLAKRNALDDAKDTLSSWDKCMAKAYCKWPVIVVIVIASLTLFSILFCIGRCICCGAECACCCFRCCAGCCGSGRGRKHHKRMGSEPTPTYPPTYPPAYPPAIDTRPPNEQYRSHPAPTISPVSNHRAPEPERPQFASFETSSKPVNEDALPAMPEWAAAKSTRVEEEVIPEKKGDVELVRFDQNGNMVGGSTLAGTTAVGAARRSPGPGRSPIQKSPTGDGYGFPPGYQNNEAVANSPPRRSPHTSPGPPGPYGAQYGQQHDQYRGASPAQSLSPVQGMGAGYAQNQQYERSPPNQAYNQQHNRPPQGHSPAPQIQNDYGYGPSDVSQEYDDTPAPGAQQSSGYGPVRSNTSGYNPSRSNTPGYTPTRSHTPAYVPFRSNTPGYAASSAHSESTHTPTEPTRFELPAAYPGQPTYEPEATYPGQQTYQAFSPGASQGQQQPSVARRPINGSWKDV